MTIVRCPRCRDEVTVPAKASPKALVRCPLCTEEYTLVEALAEHPPALIVLDGSAEIQEPALVGAEMAAGEYRLSGGGFDAAIHTGGPAQSVAAPVRPAVRGARPKKKERSAIVELVKIVLGGLIGISLAPVLLWWVFNNDSFDLGPKVAPYAPWLVPVQFRGKPENDASAAAASPSSNPSDSSPVSGRSGAGGKQPSGSAGSKPSSIAQSSATTPAALEIPPAISDPPGGLTTDPEVKPILLPLPNIEPPGPAVKPKPETPPEKPETPPAPPAEPTPTAKAPPTAEDFQKAVLAAADSLSKVNASADQSREARQKLFTDMYLAASEAGRTVSYLNAADADLAEQVATLKTFLATLAAQPGKVSALKALTDLHLPQRKHDDGALLAGVVQDVKAAGSLFECTLQVGKSLTETTVVCTNNPQDFCQPGDELLIVGRVIENPKKNLPGYKGEQARVMLLSYAVTVPKAAP